MKQSIALLLVGVEKERGDRWQPKHLGPKMRLTVLGEAKSARRSAREPIEGRMPCGHQRTDYNPQSFAGKRYAALVNPSMPFAARVVYKLRNLRYALRITAWHRNWSLLEGIRM